MDRKEAAIELMDALHSAQDGKAEERRLDVEPKPFHGFRSIFYLRSPSGDQQFKVIVEEIR